MATSEHKYKTYRLAGKVAILTASSQGIGLATAERLAHEGAKVVISSRNQKNVDEAVESLIQVGVTKESIAAIACPHVLKVNPQQWDKIFDVNVKAPFILSQMCVPHMQAVGGGVIIFNASLSALRNSEGIFVYGMSKTMLLGLGIRVNSVIPGQIKTRMSQQMWDPTHPRHTIVKQSVINSAAPSPIWLPTTRRFVTGENHLVHGGVDARL
ncbi:Dehydrogenase/reductase SDR family member 4 [Aphelenchoides fujianensis]|nr:Dehydrogenase/reductase SDR family member 4 [Aphelenchoides fujianensis]